MKTICRNCEYWIPSFYRANNGSQLGLCIFEERLDYYQEYHSCKDIKEINADNKSEHSKQ